MPIHKTNHPLGTDRKGVDSRDAINGILFFSEQVVNGTPLTQRVFLPLALHIVAFKSGGMQVPLSDFGKMALFKRVLIGVLYRINLKMQA